jgi:hypothetical protein
MKRAILTLATLALIAVPMFGQDGGTKKTGDPFFGEHRLGETFNEWLAVFHLDVGAACVAKTPEAVKFLAEIEDPDARGPSLCRALVDIQSRPNDDWMFNTANNTTWRVSNGNISQITVTNYLEHTTTGLQIAFLTQEYGTPFRFKTVTFQNGSGATWQCPEVTWRLANGAEIKAGEYIAAEAGNNRAFQVRFTSPELMKTLATHR